MTDHDSFDADVNVDDSALLGRMRAALDEAAVVEPSTVAPVEHPPLARGRWLAIAAAAVLVVGGVAALALNLSGGGTTPSAGSSTAPVPGPDTVLTGVATIIDEGLGDGPRLAVELAASLPPQGGDIPLANFEWDLVDGEETLNSTTWSAAVHVTGRWDGTAFTIDRPTTPFVTGDLTAPDLTPTDGCAESTAQAAASAVGALDWKTLHLSSWYGSSTGGLCGAAVTAWFDTPELRAAIDAVRADGHEVTMTYVFHPVDDPTPIPSTVPDTTPTPTTPAPNGSDTVYSGNAAIIDNGDGKGPMIAFAFEDSLPPHGGSLPLHGFDWSMVEGERTVGDVTWIGTQVGLVGTHDGTAFTLTQPVQPPFTGTDDVLTFGSLTPGCTDADVAPALETLGAADSLGLGIIEASDYRWDGHCGLQVFAMFDTPKLRDAFADVEDLIVRIAFTPVQSSSDSGTTTTDPLPSTTDAVSAITVPADWMFMLEAPEADTAFEVQLGTNPSLGRHLPDVSNTPLTAAAANPVTISGDANVAPNAVAVPYWPLGTRLVWHDRVGGNAAFVVTGVVTNSGSKVEGTTDGHVLVVDVRGPGDEQWTALATRAPEVAGRFSFTNALRTPNEDVWSTDAAAKEPAAAPMYIVAMPQGGALTRGSGAMILSERTDVGEAMNFAQIGSTARWQPLVGMPSNLVVVERFVFAPGPAPDVPGVQAGTVLIAQAPLPDGGWVQLAFGFVTG